MQMGVCTYIRVLESFEHSHWTHIGMALEYANDPNQKYHSK